jgi:hypothetical protein
MVCRQVMLFEQLSLAFHVRTTLKFPGHEPALVTVPTTVMETLVPSHTSTADGRSNAHGKPHSTTLSSAQIIWGGRVSTIEMVWLQTLLLPQLSVALHVRTMFVNVGQRGTAAVVIVLIMRMTTFVPSQASAAKGAVKVKGLPHSTIRLSPQVMFGGVVSTIVIVWLHRLLFPQLSLALHVRTMFVKPGQRGLAAVVTVLTIRIDTFVPSQMSTANGGVKANGLPHSTI